MITPRHVAPADPCSRLGTPQQPHSTDPERPPNPSRVRQRTASGASLLIYGILAPFTPDDVQRLRFLSDIRAQLIARHVIELTSAADFLLVDNKPRNLCTPHRGGDHCARLPHLKGEQPVEINRPGTCVRGDARAWLIPAAAASCGSLIHQLIPGSG